MTTISPDSPLRISTRIPLAMTLIGLLYIVGAVLLADGSH
jgi:hypothetical protein